MHAFRIPALLCVVFALASCDRGDTPSRAPMAATTTGDAANSATATSNGITLRASVVETGGLQESVARGYGIERLPDQAMLLLSVRDAKGDNATPVSLQATVSDLKGNTRPLPLREIRTGDLVDRIGLVPLSPPDTLTFEVRAQLVPGATSTVRLSRDFYPVPVN